MIRDAVIYLPAEADLASARFPVAGRPVVFRVLVTALRAGIERVHVPTVFQALLTPALAASPSARRAVRWITPDTKLDADAVLLVPATVLRSAPALAQAAAGTPPTVIGEATDGAPVAAMPGGLLGALWTSLAAGGAVGERLAALVRTSDPQIVRGAPVLRVTDAASARAAEHGLYAGLGSVIDTALDRQVHRRLSRHVSRLAVRLGITPNAISVASLVVGLAAAACFSVATPAAAVAGLAVYLAAVVLDHADGEVARLTLTESALGAKLDVLVDTIVHAAVVLALGVATARLAGGGVGLGVLAMAGVIASAAAAHGWPATAREDRVGRLLDDLSSRDGFYAMLVAFLAGAAYAPAALPALMVIVATGSHAYWVGRLGYRLVKTDRKPK